MAKKRASQLPKDAVSDPEKVRRLLGEGARLLAAKKPDEAIVRLTEAWELDPENVATAINLGGAYILRGKHKQAVPLLEAASRLEPDNAMIWSNLAAAYLGKLPLSTTEREQQAIEAYERALSLDPRAPHVHYNLGLIYLERDEPLRAASCFRSALETDPGDRDARHWLDQIEASVQAEPASNQD